MVFSCLPQCFQSTRKMGAPAALSALEIPDISLRLLALILCSNCSNSINIELGGSSSHYVKLLFANWWVPCACTTPATHGLGISRAALTRAPLFNTPTPPTNHTTHPHTFQPKHCTYTCVEMFVVRSLNR